MGGPSPLSQDSLLFLRSFDVGIMSYLKAHRIYVCNFPFATIPSSYSDYDAFLVSRDFKDKQQKGEFAIDGYTVRMNNTLRKDGKKDCCFEISAPDKRIYQFTAATPKEAEEWLQEIKFVLQDLGSNVIPEEEEYDDVGQVSPPVSTAAIDDDIYEELPEEEESAPPKTEEPKKQSQGSTSNVSGDKNTNYANFYQGLWDCTGDVSDELSFKRGDVIYILSKDYDRFGWWVGEMKGTIGLVPRAYIMEMYDI
ncbi:src kinase-associated phosphoprotein 2 isoform X3 [Gopherus evgoodei]|uniref:src kinase-associated phosphoprotein 2 isoform X3 n=1 Tax=Gopherus evgoodei TaxID=1825980 RepID=UPI0011CF460C|nr:src kinase-associated phosphoprotein 2 isoform X3 [Gopherus evgoodei]